MLGAGLLGEALMYRDKAAESGAGQAIGHKEFSPYFSGECSLEEATEKLK